MYIYIQHIYIYIYIVYTYIYIYSIYIYNVYILRKTHSKFTNNILYENLYLLYWIYTCIIHTYDSLDEYIVIIYIFIYSYI